MVGCERAPILPSTGIVCMASMLFCDTRNRGLCETRMCRAMLIGSLPFFLFGCFAFQTRSKIENLVGEFASGMTNILGKFV